MRIHSLSLTALALALPLGVLGCQAEDASQTAAIDGPDVDSDDAQEAMIFTRALVVDGVVIVYGADGESSDLDLDLEVVDVHGFAGDRLLLAASPRQVHAGSDEIGGHDLYSVAPDGSDLKQLSFGQEVVRASWSEARGRVVVSTRSMEIGLIDPDAPEEIEIIADHAITPALSVDGERLAYGRLPDDWSPGGMPESIDLHVLDVDAGVDRPLTSGFDDIEPIWAPDGEALLFLSGGRTGVHSFWRVEADGGVPEQMTNVGLELVDDSFVPSPSSNAEVQWSADGSALLFGAHYTESGEVHALRFAGGAAKLQSFGAGVQPRWAADGSITAIELGESALSVAEIDAESGERHVLERYAGALTTPMSSVREDDNGELSSPSDAALETLLNPTDGPQAASGVKFQLPMDNYYGINFHYDNDGSWGGLRDKNCGTVTYDGHRGTDFRANYGNTIRASAGGTIYHRNDGCATTGSYGNWCGNGFGNHVRIDHGDNWRTIYGHMTNGTVTGYGWRNCNDYLGVSGSSGNSTGPHLHFEVIKYGYPYDDPFAGPCSGPETYWTPGWLQCQ